MPVNHGHEAQHLDPVWRDRANFIIATDIDPVGTDVRTEQLWVRRVDDRVFELCCIPFFTYGLALGDLVRTSEDHMVEERLQQSGRCAFRAAFPRGAHGTGEWVAGQLARMDVLVEWFSATLFAVDTRDAAHAREVEQYLSEQQILGRLEYERGN